MSKSAFSFICLLRLFLAGGINYLQGETGRLSFENDYINYCLPILSCLILAGLIFISMRVRKTWLRLSLNFFFGVLMVVGVGLTGYFYTKEQPRLAQRTFSYDRVVSTWEYRNVGFPDYGQGSLAICQVEVWQKRWAPGILRTEKIIYSKECSF